MFKQIPAEVAVCPVCRGSLSYSEKPFFTVECITGDDLNTLHEHYPALLNIRREIQKWVNETATPG